MLSKRGDFWHGTAGQDALHMDSCLLLFFGARAFELPNTWFYYTRTKRRCEFRKGNSLLHPIPSVDWLGKMVRMLWRSVSGMWALMTRKMIKMHEPVD